MGFAIYASRCSRAICLWRDMCLRHVSALRAQGRGDLYTRTFNRVRRRRTYRCFAMQNNIVLARASISRTEGAYRVSEANLKEVKIMSKTIKELAVELTIEITTVCDNIKGRAVFINQLLRSCSSIGANSYEAKYAQSTADFVNKLEIALKECYETDYWLEILFKVGSMDENTYKILANKCGAIRRKLIASITTAKGNN